MKAIQEISSLRFVFMLLIFLHHTINYYGGGLLGVEFFFILSGFVMTIGYKDRILEGPFSYFDYVKKRVVKYYPLHWLCLLLMLFLKAHRGELTSGSVVPLIFNAALLQSWAPYESVYFSFNAASWFLSDILFFVCLFPFLLKALSAIWESKKKTFLLFSLLFLGYLILCLTVSDAQRHFILYINPLTRLLDFIIGIFTAKVLLDLKKKEDSVRSHIVPLRILLYSCIPILILLSVTLPERLLLYSPVYAPFICILLILISLPSIGNNSVFSWRPFIVLGTYSFEFYMIHKVCISYLNYLKNFMGIVDKTAYLPAYLIIIMLLAIACRHLFVIPTTRLILGYSNGQHPSEKR